MFTELDVQIGTTPETQTDERVNCNLAIGGGLYAGYILGLSNHQLLGAVSSTYGIYTAVSGGGTRLNVLSVGTPGNNDVLFNPMTGRVVANSSRTVYVTYPFFGRIFRWWEGGALTLAFPHLSCSVGSATQIYAITLPYPEGFVGAVIDVLTAGPSASTIFDIKKDGVVVETITLTATSTHIYSAFTSRAKFHAGSVLSIEIRANTSAADGLFVQLIRG